MTEPTATIPDPRELAGLLEGFEDGWKRAMGIRLVTTAPEEVVAELEIGPEHLQPLGIVHGGVYAGLVETVASYGANIILYPAGQYAVGLENHTSFLHAVRGGTLRAVGRPLLSARRTALWEVTVSDDKARTVATGRVRLLVVEQGSQLGGQAAAAGGREFQGGDDGSAPPSAT